MKQLSDSRVLIVDDVKANVDMLVEALRDDYKLSVALEGAAALRSAEKNPPDLVLLDIMMPGIDGYEVCRRLRANAATRSADDVPERPRRRRQDKTHGLRGGGNDYLTKPFEVLEVKARVRSLLKAKPTPTPCAKRRSGTCGSPARSRWASCRPTVASLGSGTGLDVARDDRAGARQVGGDFFEVLRAAEDRLVIALGDVSGKGITAALFMAVAVTLLRTLARQSHGPARSCGGSTRSWPTRTREGCS